MNHQPSMIKCSFWWHYVFEALSEDNAYILTMKHDSTSTNANHVYVEVMQEYIYINDKNQPITNTNLNQK